MTPGDLAEIARLTMVLSYRWVMDGGNAQVLETFFQAQSTALRENFGAATVIGNLKEKASFDLEVIDFLSQQGDTSFVSWALLYSVNRSLAPNANAIKLDSSVHFEHVAPQSETEEWKVAAFGKDESKYDDYEDWVTQIGNLTLLDVKINIQLQQSQFESKKVKYLESVLLVARDLAAVEEWSAAEIESRTKWLADCFEVLWSVEKSAKPLTKFSEWYKSQSGSN